MMGSKNQSEQQHPTSLYGDLTAFIHHKENWSVCLKVQH
jgi:hypothetical protein